MKIAVISDTHLGFGKGTERFEESFSNALQAFKLAAEEKADLVLIPGDVFDSDTPSQDVWHKTFELFSFLKKQPGSARILKEKKGDCREFVFSSLPVIAIAGTHEYLGKERKNALEVLEAAGFLVCLHAAKATAEIAGQKIVVQGLSGVPEKKALDALKLWSPKPVQGEKNVLLLHQSIKQFLPFDDDMIASIAIEDLPEGFDLIINGHLHWHSFIEEKNHRLLIPGSTIITQAKRLESEKEKGIVLWDSETNAIEFKPLPVQRKLFYEKIDFKDASPEQIKEIVSEKISSLLAVHNSPIKPLVRLKLVGKLAKGVSPSDVSLAETEKQFSSKAILSISRDFSMTSFKEKMKELRELQKEKKSIAALGMDILEKNLAETSFKEAFDVKEIFALLAEGETDKVVELLSEKKPVGEKRAFEENHSAVKKEIGRKQKTGTLSDFS